MILNVHSDASYLSAPKARSRAGGYFFLDSLPRDGDPIRHNDTTHVQCTILKLVAASAAEAELVALFLTAQDAKVFCLIRAELGPSRTTHPNTHRQHNNSRHCQQHHQTTTITFDGNAILLVTRW
jgi:hypothetical protein